MPFRAWHLAWLSLQEEQRWFTPTVPYGIQLQAAGPAFTAFAGTEVVGCAGIIPLWTGRAQVWSLMSDLVRLYPIPIHRAVKRYIEQYDVTRLECTVDPRSPRAVAWVQRLGFTYEGTLRKYTPIGTDMDLYVRIKD